MGEFFRISVIDGALNLCRHRHEYPELSIESAVRQLRNGPAVLSGYDYKRAIELGNQVGWDAFFFLGTRQVQLQETLKRLAMRLKPLWACGAHLGRERVIQTISEDQHQCLDTAGLLAVPLSATLVTWWDELGTFSRTEMERHNIEIGREGERLTMEYETQRLKHEGILEKPTWVALEDNRTGYDVHSFQRIGDKIKDLHIEVKSSAFSPTHFIMSRAEWNTALKQPNLHLFHIWNLETGELLPLSVSEMTVHIPVDAGAGQWHKVRVVLT